MMACKTSHTCDRCSAPAEHGVTVEAVGFDDRFDRNAICPLRYPDRDLCADCYSAFCAWFNGGRP